MASIDTGEMELSEEEQQKIIEENISILAEPTEEEKEWKRKQESGEFERGVREEAIREARVIKDKSLGVDERMKVLERLRYDMQTFDIYGLWKVDEVIDAFVETFLDKETPLKLRAYILDALCLYAREEENMGEGKFFKVIEGIATDKEENWLLRQGAIIRKEAPDWLFSALFTEKEFSYIDIYNIQELTNVLENQIERVERGIEDFDPKRIEEITNFLERLKKYSK